MSKKFLVALALPILALAACKSPTASVTDDEAMMEDETSSEAMMDDTSSEAMMDDDSAMEKDEPMVDANAEAEMEVK